MRCVKCGQEGADDSQTCDRCRTEENVQLLSRQERDSFQGITIDQGDGAKDHGNGQRDNGSRVYIKNIDLSNSSWLNKLLIAAAIIALLFAGIFIGGIVIVLALAGWLISKIFRR